MLKSATLAIALALGLASCGPLNTLDEMNETTQNMNDTTRELNDGTGRVEETTAKSLELLRDQGSHLREEYLNEMYEASNMNRKLIAGSKYMQAFKFQTWTGQGGETDEDYQAQLQSAVKEFLLALASFRPEGAFSAELCATEPAWAEYCALAIVVSRVKDTRSRLDPNAESLLDVMQRSFDYEEAFERGEAAPGYAFETLGESDAVLELLNARVNILVARALKTYQEQLPQGTALSGLKVPAIQKNILGPLVAALETYAFLGRKGLDPKLDAGLQTALASLPRPNTSGLQGGPGGSTVQVQSGRATVLGQLAAVMETF